MSVFDDDPNDLGKLVPQGVGAKAGSPGYSKVPSREDHSHTLNLSDVGIEISADESAMIFYHQDSSAVRSRIRWSKNTSTTGIETFYMEGPIWPTRAGSPQVRLSSTTTDQVSYLTSGATGSGRPYSTIQATSYTTGNISIAAMSAWVNSNAYSSIQVNTDTNADGTLYGQVMNASFQTVGILSINKTDAYIYHSIAGVTTTYLVLNNTSASLSHVSGKYLDVSSSGILANGHLGIPGNGTGNVQVRLGGLSDASNIIDYINSPDSATPYANGPRLAGVTGWSFYHAGSGYRMGFRGNSANSIRYLWNADYTILGSAPNDALSTHTLRIAGNQYVSSTLEAAGSITTGGQVYSAGMTSTQPITVNYDGGAAPVSWGNQNIIFQGNTNVGISFHIPPATYAPYLRHYTGFGRIDCVDSAGTGYATLGAAAFSVVSTIRVKKNVVRQEDDELLSKMFWATSSRYERKNRPQIFRPTKRFKEVNKKWVEKGNKELEYWHNPENFTFEDHDCTIDDCKGTAENPCNYEHLFNSPRLGPLAEEVQAIFPEAVSIDPEGLPDAIFLEQMAGQTFGAVGALIRTVTDVILRLDKLEGKKNGPPG